MVAQCLGARAGGRSRALREKVPRNWHVYCDQVTDNFRVNGPADFRGSHVNSV